MILWSKGLALALMIRAAIFSRSERERGVLGVSVCAAKGAEPGGESACMGGGRAVDGRPRTEVRVLIDPLKEREDDALRAGVELDVVVAREGVDEQLLLHEFVELYAVLLHPQEAGQRLEHLHLERRRLELLFRPAKGSGLGVKRCLCSEGSRNAILHPHALRWALRRLVLVLVLVPAPFSAPLRPALAGVRVATSSFWSLSTTSFPSTTCFDSSRMFWLSGAICAFRIFSSSTRESEEEAAAAEEEEEAGVPFAGILRTGQAPRARVSDAPRVCAPAL